MGKVVVLVWPVVEGVDRGERISGNDKEVFDVISIGSCTSFGSPFENVCVIQCWSLCDEVGELKGFAWICSEVGVEPN